MMNGMPQLIPTKLKDSLHSLNVTNLTGITGLSLLCAAALTSTQPDAGQTMIMASSVFVANMSANVLASRIEKIFQSLSI